MAAEKKSLISDDQAGELPPIGSTGGRTYDATAYVRWFHPTMQWEAFILEYDPKTRQAYALIRGTHDEIDYLRLDDMEQINWGGLPIERDADFTPRLLRDAAPNLAFG